MRKKLALLNSLMSDAGEEGLVLSTIDMALGAIRKHLRMDVAYVSEFVDGKSVFRGVDAPGLENLVKVGDAHSLDDVYCRHILEGRLPQLMADTADHPLAQSMPITSAVPIGTHVSVPITLADGSVYGMFCCFSSKANPSLNERDLEITRAFADIAANQVARDLDAERELSVKRQRIQATLEHEDFSILFQPIWNFGKATPKAFECLARFPGVPYRTPDLWFAEAVEVGSDSNWRWLSWARLSLLSRAFPSARRFLSTCRRRRWKAKPLQLRSAACRWTGSYWK